jgi:uncharacterized protein (TIGR03382 family)
MSVRSSRVAFPVRTLSAALVTGAALLAGASTATGTVLTFQMGSVADGSDMNVSPLSQYGSRVGDPFFDALRPEFVYGAGGGITPNVVVEYSLNTKYGISRAPGRRFGDLEDVIYRTPGGDNTIEVGLFALGSGNTQFLNVALFSFDIAGVLGEDLPVRSVKVLDGVGNVLFSDPSAPGQPLPIAPGIPVQGQPTRKTYDFVALLGAPITAPTVRLRVDVGQVAGKVDRFGLDNIKFGQVQIPSPGSMALLALGGLVVIGRRRGR